MLVKWEKPNLIKTESNHCLLEALIAVGARGILLCNQTNY